jgi:hypothetical protein
VTIAAVRTRSAAASHCTGRVARAVPGAADDREGGERDGEDHSGDLEELRLLEAERGGA